MFCCVWCAFAIKRCCLKFIHCIVGFFRCSVGVYHWMFYCNFSLPNLAVSLSCLCCDFLQWILELFIVSFGILLDDEDREDGFVIIINIYCFSHFGIWCVKLLSLLRLVRFLGVTHVRGVASYCLSFCRCCCYWADHEDTVANEPWAWPFGCWRSCWRNLGFLCFSPFRLLLRRFWTFLLIDGHRACSSWLLYW